jgi:hypothetical protein
MSLTKFVMQPTIHVPHTFFLNPHNRCKCNVGCITNFVRLIIIANHTVYNHLSKPISLFLSHLRGEIFGNYQDSKIEYKAFCLSIWEINKAQSHRSDCVGCITHFVRLIIIANHTVYNHLSKPISLFLSHLRGEIFGNYQDSKI